MSRRHIRLWTARAVRRSPLTRVADRVEAWSVVTAFFMLVGAVIPALAIGQLGYEARLRTVAADAASSHSVEATAQGNSMADPSGAESPTTTFMVNVQWSAQNITHETVARVDGPVKAGDRVQVWVNDQGNVTTPPPTDTDARVMRIGTVALTWLMFAALIVGALALLRIRLNQVRDRRWDRGWRDLVENGGGSATITP